MIFAHIILLIMLVPVLVVAQELPICTVNDEVLPSWACHADKTDNTVYTSVGVGNSYQQAISFALCNISQDYLADIGEKRDVDVEGKRRYTKLHFGNDIDIVTLHRQYRPEAKVEVEYYRCRIGVNANEGDVFVDERIIKTVNDNATSMTNDSKYVLPTRLELPTALIENNVEIVDVFVSKNYHFYVLVSIRKIFIKKI